MELCGRSEELEVATDEKCTKRWRQAYGMSDGRAVLVVWGSVWNFLGSARATLSCWLEEEGQCGWMLDVVVVLCATASEKQVRDCE